MLISIAVLLWVITVIGWYITEPSFEPLNVLVSAMLSTLLAGLSWLKSRKSSASNSEPSSTTNIENDVHAGVMITGGTNITVNSSPSQLNYLLVNSRSSEESSEYFERILGINTYSVRYDKEQFEVLSEYLENITKIEVGWRCSLGRS